MKKTRIPAPPLDNRGEGGYTPTRNADDSVGNDAGWSSPVARRAHNPKVVGSSPTPAPIREFIAIN